MQRGHIQVYNSIQVVIRYKLRGVEPARVLVVKWLFRVFTRRQIRELFMICMRFSHIQFRDRQYSRARWGGVRMVEDGVRRRSKMVNRGIAGLVRHAKYCTYVDVSFGVLRI